MTQQQVTDQKMDTQTKLLKWILAGVGTGVTGAAIWMASYIGGLMTDRKEGEAFLRKEVKEELIKISASGEAMAKGQETANEQSTIMLRTMERQTDYLRDMRDDQRKFPAVAERMP